MFHDGWSSTNFDHNQSLRERATPPARITIRYQPRKPQQAFYKEDGYIDRVANDINDGAGVVMPPKVQVWSTEGRTSRR